MKNPQINLPLRAKMILRNHKPETIKKSFIIILFIACMLVFFSCVTSYQVPNPLIGDELSLAWGEKIIGLSKEKLKHVISNSEDYFEFKLTKAKYFKDVFIDTLASLGDNREIVWLLKLSFPLEANFNKNLIYELIDNLEKVYGKPYKKENKKLTVRNGKVERDGKAIIWILDKKLEIKLRYFEPNTILKYPEMIGNCSYFWLTYSRFNEYDFPE